MSLIRKNILICGHRSFAAQGLEIMLQKAGHNVIKFSRGGISKKDNTITGPISQFYDNPHFRDIEIDIIVNYILLSDESLKKNETYLKDLLQLCKEKSVKYLIQISSISSYKDKIRKVDEESEIERDPANKGSYGSIKVAQDVYLMKNLPDDLSITYVRPGFILGEGLPNPIIGNGFRTPWSNIVILGNPKSKLPLISREQVNIIIAKLVKINESQPQVVLLADSNSPSKKEYLNKCCHILGYGKRTISFPLILFRLIGVVGTIFSKIFSIEKLDLNKKMASICYNRTYNPKNTERYFDMSLSFDWELALRNSMRNQNTNAIIPKNQSKKLSIKMPAQLTFLGFGRIVKQQHLEALKYLNYSGDILGCDISDKAFEQMKTPVKRISHNEVGNSSFLVIATPGPSHYNAMPLLDNFNGNVLIEKPLCYNKEEFEGWMKFKKESNSEVYVNHNYRFKTNVLEMISFLNKYNPGTLLKVSVVFQSLPVIYDGAAWLRKEREARTLLMDYALHYLDIACMFGKGEWKINRVNYELDLTGRTDLIEGQIQCNSYPVDFILRQGFIQRKQLITFYFQNYSINLRFFPDTFMPVMAADYYWTHKNEASLMKGGFYKKIYDKMLSKDLASSQQLIYSTIFDKIESFQKRSISIEGVENFYNLLFKLSEEIYNE